MAISPYDQETRQRAVRLYFEELADGASSKAAALRAVEAVIGIKTSTIRNWVRAEEKKVDVAVEQSDAEKDAELAATVLECDQMDIIIITRSPSEDEPPLYE